MEHTQGTFDAAWLDVNLESVFTDLTPESFNLPPYQDTVKKRINVDEDRPNKDKKIKFVGADPQFNLRAGLEIIGIGDNNYDSWSHDDLAWEPCAELPKNFEQLLPSNMDENVLNVYGMYEQVKSTAPIEWSNEDQASRFIKSFKTPMQKHKFNAISNPPFIHTRDEMNRLSKNCESWLNKIKELKIDKESDLKFILRPDFPDVIAQILGVATKNKPAVLNMDYEFNLRLPPSSVERKLIQIKESLDNQQDLNTYKFNIRSKMGNPDDSVCNSIIEDIIKMYRVYEPIKEEKLKKGGYLYMKTTCARTSEDAKPDTFVKLQYEDYRTKENIIRKHILRHFRNNKHISLYLIKQMKTYEERIAYVRNFTDDVFQFDLIQCLKNIEQSNQHLDLTNLYLKYRRDYLAYKSLSRILRNDRLQVCGTYSLHPRSTYYRYHNMFRDKNLDKTKIMLITTDKTVNDVAFRFLRQANCILHVYGDFNYMRLGNEYTEFYFENNSTVASRVKKIMSYPTSKITVNLPYHEYDYVIIDTVCLAVLRNGVVYGDFQEAHDYANIVINSLTQSRQAGLQIKTQLILRAGIANICYTKSPLDYNKMKIEQILTFKATGPEVIMRLSTVQDGSGEGTNDLLIRRAILMKMQILDDLKKLSVSGMRYIVKSQKGFYSEDINVHEVNMIMTLSGKIGHYVPYSKTRNTVRFQNNNGGTDIVQTYLNSTVTKFGSSFAMRRKQKATSHVNPLSSFMTSGARETLIISALVRSAYSINDAYIELNTNGDFTMEEISRTMIRCINIPISDTPSVSDITTEILNAIRYAVRYKPTFKKFVEKFPTMKTYFLGNNDGNYEYFNRVDIDGKDVVLFRGLTDCTEEDIDDPLLLRSSSILDHKPYDVFQEYARLDSTLNENCVSPFYEPLSPIYEQQPLSPIYEQQM